MPVTPKGFEYTNEGKTGVYTVLDTVSGKTPSDYPEYLILAVDENKIYYCDGSTFREITGAGLNIETIRFKVSGTLPPAPHPKLDVAWIARRACTITGATLYRRNAGNGGSTVIDVNLNGTSIFGANPKPTVTAAGGDNQINVKTVFDTSSVAQNDMIECDLDSKETGAPKDLAVIIEVEY